MAALGSHCFWRRPQPDDARTCVRTYTSYQSFSCKGLYSEILCDLCLMWLYGSHELVFLYGRMPIRIKWRSHSSCLFNSAQIVDEENVLLWSTWSVFMVHMASIHGYHVSVDYNIILITYLSNPPAPPAPPGPSTPG